MAKIEAAATDGGGEPAHASRAEARALAGETRLAAVEAALAKLGGRAPVPR